MNIHGLDIQGRVVGALIIRDVKTRFGGGYGGFFFSVAIPFLHLSLLLVIYVATGRTAPVGTDRWAFLASTVLPFILFNYPSRMIMIGIQINKPLLYFPLVKMSDIMISRIVVEIVIAIMSASLFYIVMMVFGVDLVPNDPAVFVFALMLALFVGVSFGIFNSYIVMIFPFWGFVVNVSMSLIFIVSATFILPSAVPESYRAIFYYNPLAQSMELMRTGLYDNYMSPILNPGYAVMFALSMTLVGLAFGRIAKRILLNT